MSDTSNIPGVNSSRNSFCDNFLGRSTLSKKYEDSKCVEGLDENTSCVSQSCQANIADDSNERNDDGVNVSHSSMLLSQVASEVLRNAPHFEKPNFSNIPSTNDADVRPVRSRSPKVKVSEYSKGNTAPTCTIEAASTVVNDEPAKNPVKDEVNNKYKDLVELRNTYKPPSRSSSEDESDESDTLEHDVKVCDICGDAGHEADLAICSRCSDGAEHIYCMRDMLKKLPEGDWLCEECKAEVTKNKKQAKAVSCPQISGKRHVESTEVGPEPKRKALESGSGSPMASSPIKASQLSRESSLKSTERGKPKPGHHMYSRDQSHNGDVGMVRSPTSLQRSLGPKGPLSKSYSFNAFNSKPKVKLVDEVPPKQKGTREHIIKDLMERPGNLLRKSTSFKSVNSSQSNVTEAKVKMLSPRTTHAQDKRGLKQVKEQVAYDRNQAAGMTSSIVSPSGIDQRLMPHVESNHKELRATQDGKLSTLPKTTNSVARKDDSSAGAAGALSTGGPCTFVSEKKLSHFNPSDDSLLCFSSSSAEKSSISICRNTQDGLLPAGESVILGDKIRDTSGISSKQATAQNCNVCHKCKEVGHSTEFCTSDKFQENGSDVSAARSSEESVRKGNTLKAAIHAALLRRPEICKKKVINQEPDSLCTSNSDINVEIAEKSLVSNGSKNNMSAEVILEGRAASDNSLSGSFENSATLDAKQLSVCIGDAHSTKPGNSDLYDTSSTKPSVRNFPNQSSASAQIILETLTIPEYEYIWQGSFEVLRSGRLPEVCGGMQAHLSCCTSTKVFEVANKLPQRIHLNELPRMSVWPAQFHPTGAREDNIAIYFFAKDIESYEKYYKSLLDRMMKYDLALKVNFEGVELLVFPSTRLPEKSQRWNMLFFLWGVFRGKRTNPLDGSEKFSVPGSNKPCPQKNYHSASMTLSEPHCLPKQTEELIECDRTCNVIVTSNAPDLMRECLPDNGLDCNMPKAFDNAVSSMHEKTKVVSATSHNSFSPEVGVQRNQEKGAAKIVAVKKTVIGIDHDGERLKGHLKEDNIYSGTEPYSHRDHITDKVHLGEIENKNKLKMDLSETVSQASTPAYPKRPCSEVNDEHGESVCKKLRTDELVSCKLVENKLCNTACGEKIIHEELGGRERHFFPVNRSRGIDDFHLEEKNMLWNGLQTETLGKCQDDVPNLELALGAELKVPSKGSLPFLFGVVDKKNNQDKLPGRVNVEQAEEGEATSLSLSLPFPSSDKEQTLKPVSKSELLLPERHHVNSSTAPF